MLFLSWLRNKLFDWNTNIVFFLKSNNMNDLKFKPIPKKVTKSIIKNTLYAGERTKVVEDAIAIAMRHVHKEKYNPKVSIVGGRELKYIVAQLDNPRGFEPFLTDGQIKELQKELENYD